MYKQTSLASSVNDKNLDLVFGDVRDKFVMKNLMKSADVIIPLAAIVGAPACDKDPILAESVNKDATLWMIEQASNDQTILMPTTNSAYGSGEKNNFCDEMSPLNPLSKYAKDKVTIEKALMLRENSTSFRLATVFGLSPRMRLDLLVNNFMYRAKTDGFVVIFEGHFKRNYIHISDIVEMFKFALANLPVVKSEIFNVGLSEANISKFELCGEIQKILPNFTFLESPMGTDPDQRNYIVSNKKIEALGYKAQISLIQGLKELNKGLLMFHQSLFINT